MRGRLVLLALISLVIAIPAYAAVMFIPVPMYMGVREPRVNIGDVSNFHNVAVLSAIGSGLRLGKKNFLFKEGGKVLKIDDWNVDDQVVTTVQQLFGNRFQFKSVSYDRAALAALPNGKFDNSRTDLQKYLGVLPRDGLDAFIVEIGRAHV